MRRDCADGAGPAVEVAKPVLAASVDPEAAAGAVEVGAAAAVVPGVEDAAVEAAGLEKSEGVAVVDVEPLGPAVDVAPGAGVAVLALLNREKPDVAGVALDAAPDEAAGVAGAAASDAGCFPRFANKPVDPLVAAGAAADAPAEVDAGVAGVIRLNKELPELGAAAGAAVPNTLDMLEGVFPVDAGADLSAPRLKDGVLFPPKLKAGVALVDGWEEAGCPNPRVGLLAGVAAGVVLPRLNKEL